MTDTNQTHADWIGRTVYDSNDDKIGDVDQVYVDDVTGRPEWMTVKTGWFGSSTQFVPIAGTSMNGDDLRIGYTEDRVKDAPSIDGDGHLDADDERRLYDHYGLDFDSQHDDVETPRADEGFRYADTREVAETPPPPQPVPATDGDTSVVRSEEEVSVDKVERDAGSVRLRKYVVTEDVNLTVPVRKEVARVVRTSVDGTEVGEIADGDTEEEIVLREEEIVVDKNVVAKERVGIETETVTEERTVNETVRKEQVEIDGDVDKS